MSNILVTGSAGFIGHHLVLALLKEGHNVVGIDNLNDYYDINLKLERLNHQGFSINGLEQNVSITSTKNKNLTFRKSDLVDKNDLFTLFQKYSFDVVINLAAQAGVRYSIENPDTYIQANVVGFVNLLEVVKEFKIVHFIFASSSSVYGLNKKIPFSTKDNVDYPISLYAASKKSNELMAHVYSHLYQIPMTGIRFFTVYGPWGRPDMAYFSFTKRILEGRTIRVYNHGNLSRDFTYIDDIIKGILAIIPYSPKVKSEGSKSAPYKVYNIGNNSPINLMDFIQCIEKELNLVAKKEMVEMQPGDVETTYADISDLVQDVGYRPTTELKDGIHQFIKWYKEFYKINKND